MALERLGPIVVEKEEAISRFRPLTPKEEKKFGIKAKEEEATVKRKGSVPIKSEFEHQKEDGALETISLDLEQKVSSFEEFYKKNGINLPPDFRDRAMDIWQRNFNEIKKAVEEAGYDEILIIPETLPNLTELDAKMTTGYKNATYQGHNFKANGSFAGVKEIKENPGLRILLVHKKEAQDIKDHPLLKKTLGASPLQLSGLTMEEFQKHITNSTPIPIFLTKNDGTKLQAEGLSLTEYEIFKRKSFEENQKHLDTIGYTYLPAAFSASRVVVAYWHPGDDRLGVGSDDADHSRSVGGCRLSRSFN